MPAVERLHPGHAAAVLAFERENRAYFAESISDRGDAYFARFDAVFRDDLAEQEAGRCHFHVVTTDDGEILGRVNLYGADLGFRIAEKAAGQGLATSSVREVTTKAAANYGFTDLYAAAADENTASRTVLSRTGFTPTGEPVLLGTRLGHRYHLTLSPH